MDLADLASAYSRNRQSTPSLVAEVLREAIFRGILSGGEQLRQDEVASQFGVSRIPVREAFRQLAAEGLITLYPHRGAVVSTLSPEEVQEIYEIRIPLETLAIRLAVPKLTQADLAHAHDILHAIDLEEDSVRWGELNREFHATLYAPAGRPRLLALISNLRANVERYLRIYISLMHHKQRSQRQHREILAACKRRDVEAAAKVLDEHLSDTSELLIRFLKQQRAGMVASDLNVASASDQESSPRKVAKI